MPALAVHRPQRCLCSGWHVLTAGAPPHRQAARSYGRYVSASGARAARYLPRGTLQCVCTTHDPHRAERCRWKAVTAWLLVEDVRLGRARGGWTRLGAAAPPPAAGASMARTTHWLSVWAGTGSTGGASAWRWPSLFSRAMHGCCPRAYAGQAASRRPSVKCQCSSGLPCAGILTGGGARIPTGAAGGCELKLVREGADVVRAAGQVDVGPRLLIPAPGDAEIRTLGSRTAA